MELLKILAGLAGLMVLGSGWLTVSIWCGFKAFEFGKSKAEPLGWFLYLATALTMLVCGVATFAYGMAKLTGEI